VGAGIGPFGLDLLPPAKHLRDAAIVICEGESDTLAVRDAIAAWRGRPTYSIGLPGAGMWRPDFADHLAACPLVYVLGDGDTAGASMIDRVLQDLQWARGVRLPRGEDARSLLQRHGDDALDEYLTSADQVTEMFAAIVASPTLADLREIGTQWAVPC
jgi:DNA primase